MSTNFMEITGLELNNFTDSNNLYQNKAKSESCSEAS